MGDRYVIERYGAAIWNAHAHAEDEDCLDDESGHSHAQADHPVAALRKLMKNESG